MTRLGMLLTFAQLGLRHWLATWLRWIAYQIDRRNAVLKFCGCRWIQRPWPLPQARHSRLCEGRRA